MKYLGVILVSMLLAAVTWAGSANCTSSVTITAGVDGPISSGDCIIVVNIPVENMDYVRGYLPAPEGSTAGDQFTIKDVSPPINDSYEDPETHEIIPFSYTGGVGLQACYTNEEECEADWSFSPNRFVKAVLVNGRWVLTDGDL